MKDNMKKRIRRTCENIPRSVLAETVRSFQSSILLESKWQCF